MSNIVLTPEQAARLELLLDSHVDIKSGHQGWSDLFASGLIDIKEGYAFDQVQYKHILIWRCTLTESGKISLRNYLCKKIQELKNESKQVIPRLRHLLNRNELASEAMILGEGEKVVAAIKAYHNNEKTRLDSTRNFLELGGQMEELEY